jgi:hypothetical protein
VLGEDRLLGHAPVRRPAFLAFDAHGGGVGMTSATVGTPWRRAVAIRLARTACSQFVAFPVKFFCSDLLDVREQAGAVPV